MKKIFKLGVLINAKNVHIGLVENQYISLIERKYDLNNFEIAELPKELESIVNEVGLKLSDIQALNLVDELNYLGENFKLDSVRINKIDRFDWILSSNWIYELKEVETENLTEYQPVYPYLTIYSSGKSTDLILNEENSEPKIVGSFIDEIPENLISEINKIIEVSKSESMELTEEGDPTFLNFEYEIEPDFDLRIADIKNVVRKQYDTAQSEFSKFKPEISRELTRNLKADLLASVYEKLFDYINAKIFGIADAMQAKAISLVGSFWLNKRFQEKLIRIAAGSEFKIKFPSQDQPLPLGSFVASIK